MRNRAGRRVERPRPGLQIAATVFGLLFMIIAVLGLIPAAAAHLTPSALIPEPGAEFLGLPDVSVFHVVGGLLWGTAGVAMAGTAAGARTYLTVGGALYTALFVYGLIRSGDPGGIFTAEQPAADIVALSLGLAMIVSGLILTRRIVVGLRNTGP